MAEGLDGLPPVARAQLESFTRALERLPVDDLPLYAVRTHGPEHLRSVDTAADVALGAGLAGPIRAAQEVLAAYVDRIYANAQLQTSIAGLNTAPGLGPIEDRVRVARSLGDAVTAIVLGDALDEADQAELMGAWDRLIP